MAQISLKTPLISIKIVTGIFKGINITRLIFLSKYIFHINESPTRIKIQHAQIHGLGLQLVWLVTRIAKPTSRNAVWLPKWLADISSMEEEKSRVRP